ncbi:MAG: radical SAM protein [Euryarchaeota archaeon]|nr:radical SAM protein [Euryarchaeota archaeon]
MGGAKLSYDGRCKSIKILFIFPHVKVSGSILYTLTTYPSLTLKQLAAITPNKYSIELVDERCKKINFNGSYDLVGISCLTYNAPRAYEVADKFRRRGVPVVLGGYHPSALPEEAKQHADAVVIGEAEYSLPELLMDLEKGGLKPFYRPKKFIDPNEIPSANHQIRVDNAFMESVQATRGCPNQCQFCAIKEIEGCILRSRPIKNVIEEIKSIKKKHLFFADASLTINPSYSKLLFGEMKELNKKFDCCGNINILTKDDDFLKLASDAGCELIQVGFESISQKSIDDINKKTNKVEDYARAIRKIKDHNIMVMGLFIFGFDMDAPDIFTKTLDAIHQWNIDRAFFFILTPYPGTPIFDKLDGAGRILTKDWSKYTQMQVVFKPKNMSIDYLYNGAQGLMEDFHSLSNSLRRSFNDENFRLNRLITRTVRDISAKRYHKILSGSQ